MRDPCSWVICCALAKEARRSHEATTALKADVESMVWDEWSVFQC